MLNTATNQISAATIPPHLADGNVHTVIEGNVKKTYIPQHIYNDIPIVHHTISPERINKNQEYSEEAY